MPLSSDLRIIKDGEKRPEGRVVLRLREHMAGRAPEPAGEPEPEPDAEAAANGTVVAARIEADRIREAAQADGYREGYEEGYRQAERAGREIRARAEAVLKQAREIRAQTLDTLEPEVLALAVDIARRLVAEQLALEPEAIRSIVRTALERVRDRERFLVYAHPRDAQVLEAHPDDFRRLVAADAEVKVIADEEVRPGGCRIETELGVVDATLESRWGALLEALHGGD